MTLRDLLDGVADSLAGVAAQTMDGSTTWTVGGTAFAALGADGSTAEFALDPAVAAAATRTPDTVLSPRGPGWVAFRPTRLDDAAADRATAWFESAYRRIGRG